MENFETEEQQVEALKRFWHEYGKSIVVGAIVGLGGLYGWNHYQQTELQAQESASVAFEQILTKAQDGDELALAVDAFRDKHDGTGYTAMSDLLQARVAVDAGEYDKAAPLLERAITELDETLKPLAQLRLARVQQAQNQLDVALLTVNSIDNSAYDALREELKGDLLIAKGDVTGARTAYQAALAAGGSMSNPALQMKIDELAQAS